MQFGTAQINNFKEISEDILEIFSDLELHESIDFRVGGEWIIYYQSGGVDYIKSPDEINGKILRYVPSPWSWESKKVKKIEKGFIISYRISLTIKDKGGVSVQFLSNLTKPIITRIKNAHPYINLENIIVFIGDERYGLEKEYSPEDWSGKTKIDRYEGVRDSCFYFEIYKDRVIDPQEAKDEVWDVLSNLESEFKNLDLHSWKAKDNLIMHQFEFLETPTSDDLYKIFGYLISLIEQSEKLVGVKFKEIELLKKFTARTESAKNVGLWVQSSRGFDNKIGLVGFNVIFEC